MKTIAQFKEAIKDTANGIAPETQAMITPIAEVASEIYGGVRGTTLMSVCVNFPFSGEHKAFLKGQLTALETIAPDDPEPEPEV